MKLISLNVWGGKLYDPLLEFINQQKKIVDVFVFQEVLKSDKSAKTNSYHANLLVELKNALPNHSSYFSPRAINIDPHGKSKVDTEFGQATLIKKDFKIIENNEIFVYRNSSFIDNFFDDGGYEKMPSNILCSEILLSNKKVLIINLHGLVEYAPKADNEHRLRQSQIIIDHIEYMNLPTILAGDFNLRIETKSLSMFEDFGMRNLLKESGAKTTRTRHYEEKWRKIDPYADYILTTPDIRIKKFEVLEDVVSDHLPLQIDFEI